MCVLRLRRIATIVAVVLALVLSLGAGLSFWFVRRSFPQTDGTLEVPGLKNEVRVVRDQYGVPQIYAHNSDDLFFAQGYVQAQDRFFQMDFRRHVTSGRLSELFGPQALETDMFVRTMGWHDVAAREFALLDASTREYLEAFSAGVNAYLDGRGTTQLSLEYGLLGLGGSDYAPDEWTPVDSLAWLKAMAWDLRSNMPDEVDRTLASSVLTQSEVDDLYPPYPVHRHDPVVTQGAVVGGVYRQDATPASAGRPVPAASSAPAVREMRGVQRASRGLPRLLGTGSGIGSNAWAVSGQRSGTGKPLLASDPHLAPTMPSVWYQMGLHCTDISPSCPFDVSGFTFAGLPGVVIGHNDRIAWGMTTMPADVTDLYLERVHGNSYRYDGRDLPLKTHQETFHVAGGRTVTTTVRSTRDGPLISDVDDQMRQVAALGSDRLPSDVKADPGATGTQMAVALRWTALDPNNTADALFGIDAARNWDDFRAAARDFAVPTQNLVYADAAGHIGYQAPGRIPIRRTGTGDWPVPGWDPDYRWTGYVPFRALPNVLDPKSGYVVSANQQVAEPSYPFYLGDSWSYGYRSQRIQDLLEGDGSLSVKDMAAMQMDSRNGMAATLLPYLLKLRIGRHYVRQGQRVLQDWDLRQPADSAGAAYFNVVWRNLLARTFHDQLPRSVWPDGSDRGIEVVRNLLRDPHSHWWDNVRTENVEETRDDILRSSMAAARYEITRQQARDPSLWTWGHLHQLKLVQEPMGRSGNPIVDRLLNRGPYEVGGGDSVVDATGWTASKGYGVDWVPSMRMVVSLGNLDSSRWVNLTGASGHAFDPHYDDQFPLWRDGETTPWPFSLAAVGNASAEELRLVPKRPEVPSDGLG